MPVKFAVFTYSLPGFFKHAHKNVKSRKHPSTHEITPYQDKSVPTI